MRLDKTTSNHDTDRTHSGFKWVRTVFRPASAARSRGRELKHASGFNVPAGHDTFTVLRLTKLALAHGALKPNARQVGPGRHQVRQDSLLRP